MQIVKLHLDLSDQCNLSCLYCYVHKERAERRAEMNKEEWLEVIRQGAEMGISNFVISGGEPLIAPGFLEIIGELKRRNLTATIMTNLSGTEQNIIDATIESGVVKEIVTSLDGFRGHNLARPPSDWREVAGNIRRLKKRDGEPCRVTVNTVLHRYNLGELEDLQEFLADLGVDAWRLDIPIKPNNLAVMPDLERVAETGAALIARRYASPRLQKMAMVLFRAYKSHLEGISLSDALSQSDLTSHPCEYFFGRFAIKPDGSITLCSPLRLSLGQIDFKSGKDLCAALAEAEGNRFFDLRVGDIEDCRNCRYLNLCGSGCRADALSWTGSATAADPVACTMMPLVERIIMPVLSPSLKIIYAKLIRAEGMAPAYASLCPLERRWPRC